MVQLSADASALDHFEPDALASDRDIGKDVRVESVQETDVALQRALAQQRGGSKPKLDQIAAELSPREQAISLLF